MSFIISPRISNKNNNNNIATNDDDSDSIQNEWVEIIEPKSKTKIYANLQSGVCAKNPPDGVPILTSDDFSDHWWELYDKKSGKYYYYNPEQQRTVWTRPTSNGDVNSRRLLIIPVSKLRTFKKLSTDEQTTGKCDASTQTIASNLVSTGTQTISETVLEEMLNDKLRITDTNDDSYRSNGIVYPTKDSKSPSTQAPRQQLLDLTSRHCNPYLNHYQKQPPTGSNERKKSTHDQVDNYKSSQHDPLNQRSTNLDGLEYQAEVGSYFGPAPAYNKNRNSMKIQAPVNNYASNRRDELKSSTSTFKSGCSTRTTENAEPTGEGRSSYRQDSQQMVTNNLSHYLVREARSMGIALISDDEIDDDDQDSDDECNLDDDEDTDLRDDLSSHRMNELNASQDLGEDSSEGWKSLSDQGSPNGPKNQLGVAGDNSHRQFGLRSPTEVAGSSFTHDDILDNQGNPTASKSQQLDHRKLVENFKKSRQSSAMGFNDSLRRSYRLDANQAVQKIKTVADSYFQHGDKDRSSEKHMKNLSIISTLPRNNSKIKENLRQGSALEGSVMDADYDVVEENCGYYSDSDHLQVNPNHAGTSKTSQTSTNKKGGESSPVSYFDRHKSTRGSTFSVESFARENLTRHPKGGLLFNRKVKWSRMISWTKNSIRQPMITSVSSDLSSDSITSFKLIQQFMGDRKVTIGKKYRQLLAQAGVSEDSYRKNLVRSGSLNISNTSSSSAGTNSTSAPQIPDLLRDELAYELAVKGCVKSPLRDEIFVQLARQLTDNPSSDSISWGLILMSILLSYFSPSSKFAPFLLAFLETHSHAMARDVCLPRLEKRLRQNWLSYCRKPADGKEISIVRLSITKWPQYCGVFGESLERTMSLQSCSPFLKTLRLPWILTTLGDKLIETGGFETEGVFRCAADHDLLAQLRLEIDCVDFRKITDAKQVKSLLLNVQDPHVIAGLLKLFFRQLFEPVFPAKIYDLCLGSGQDNQMACCIFNERLPNLNKDVVAYLIRLLQQLSQSDRVVHTKMDTSNLSMVWAPNLLRAPEFETTLNYGDSRTGSKWSIANGDDQNSSTATTATVPSQSMIFEQTRQEMQFIKALITHLDTSFIKDVM